MGYLVKPLQVVVFEWPIFFGSGKVLDLADFFVDFAIFCLVTLSKNPTRKKLKSPWLQAQQLQKNLKSTLIKI